MTTTPAQLIEACIKYRDFKKAKADEFALAMKPYAEAMDLIEGQLLAFMNDQGLATLKADCGTAYQVVRTAVKLEDRQAFLSYLFGLVHGDDPLASEFIANIVPKEPAMAYMEAHNGMLPPGLALNRETVVNVRRT